MGALVEYDAIIVGTGQSGPSLAGRLAQSGMEVAIIERKLFGGTCVNVGCTPTKALVASAYAAYISRHADQFGVKIDGSISVDMKAIKARKDEIVKHSSEGLEKWLKSMKNCTVYEGQGELESAKTVRVNGEVLTADKIFLNVGCRATVPKIPGLDTVSYLTNTTMMDLDTLPSHLIIIGGGYIGLEFAQVYRRFGSKVTILARGARVLARDDDDVCEAVVEILTGEGIDILTNVSEMAVSKEGADVRVNITREGKKESLEGSHLLVAVGRIPNTHDLGLDAASVEVNERGYIKVDEELKTSQPGIWAMGDCNGLGAFTHTSYNEYEIIAANLLDGKKRSVSDRIFTYGLFIDPPLGRVGMTEKQALSTGRKILCAKMPMTQVARAREKGETRGFMKIYVDAESKQILGAALLGTGCDEAVHLILDTMQAKAPYTTLANAMHIHPTVSELIPTLLQGLKPLEAN